MYNLQDVSVDVGGLRLCEKRCTKQTNKQTNKSTSSSCQLMHIAQIRLHLSTTASDPLWSSGLLLKWSVTNARVPLSAGRDERVACCPCNPVWPQLGPATVGLHPQLGPTPVGLHPQLALLQSDFIPNWPHSSRTSAPTGPTPVGLHPQLALLQSDFIPNWPHSSRTSSPTGPTPVGLQPQLAPLQSDFSREAALCSLVRTHRHQA